MRNLTRNYQIYVSKGKVFLTISGGGVGFAEQSHTASYHQVGGRATGINLENLFVAINVSKIKTVSTGTDGIIYREIGSKIHSTQHTYTVGAHIKQRKRTSTFLNGMNFCILILLHSTPN